LRAIFQCFGWYSILLGLESVDSYIFMDPDPGSSNVADPMAQNLTN